MNDKEATGDRKQGQETGDSSSGINPPPFRAPIVLWRFGQLAHELMYLNRHRHSQLQACLAAVRSKSSTHDRDGPAG